MLPFILILFVVLSAFTHIQAEYRGPEWHIYIFKPLTMVFICLIAILGQAAPPFYKYMIIAGLAFSLAGDVFLMLPTDRFIEGLVAFLIAHLFYIAAFSSQLSMLAWWPLLPLVIFGMVVFRYISPSLGNLKIPVFFYIAAILIMAWFAWEWWHQSKQIATHLALAGAFLFVISDTTLAINRFRGKFKLARALILTTYFAAQWFIASSIGLSIF